jgi:hypothetical protein
VKPVCYDLFCGLGGWSEGFLAEGYECIGFDIEAHDYGTGGYPGTLILRDIRSIHGSELKDAAVIVASPPCQAYSYRAMPWKRAKALPPPDNTLFDECFRIQREASEAAGHYIPLIVENVRGAQKWVGRAQWNYGSFYLWGDVPALMPHTLRAQKEGSKNNGGSWFAIGSPGQKVTGQNPDGRKVGMNFHEHEKTGKPGRSFQSAAVEEMGVKNGKDWFGSGENCSLQRRASSKSNSRKAASAMIAKIPFPLAQHIARTFKPEGF